MNKWMAKGLLLLSLSLALTACGAGGGKTQEGADAKSGSAAETTALASNTENKDKEAAPSGETRTITYLDQTYTVPAKKDLRIVISGSMESMEDAVVLDAKPVGAISVSGQFPDLFKKATTEAVSVGEKMEPDYEGILKLKPDIILASTKFKPEAIEKFKKITTTVPVSHVSTNWEANLKLLAELTGKEKEAEEALNKYKADLDAAKAKLGDKLKDKKVLAVRVRKGDLAIYPEGVFFNASLYKDLGFTAPAEVKAAKAQELISLEKFSEINPDYLFVQFSPDENKDTPKALEELENNPIWKSINAVKNGKVFVNVVDPLAQGGTALSKFLFLEAAVDKLSQ
ncbi:ABC transporter substrate-binding protein [Paenibacillus alvei]|uniref:ABC transporter substrate-binding protein n=1 Tax=Paenibacillus alvei TaxID=44250 RepID=UPI003D29FC02